MANAKVTKTQLIDQIAEQMQVSKTQAEEFLGAFIDSVSSNLKEGSDVTITGFGTFRTTHRQSRKGVNPQTGEPTTIPASTSVSFKAGKNLKDAVS